MNYYPLYQERCPLKRNVWTRYARHYGWRKPDDLEPVGKYIAWGSKGIDHGGDGGNTIRNCYLHNQVHFRSNDLIRQLRYWSMQYDLIWMQCHKRKRFTKEAVICVLKNHGIGVE